MKWYQKPFPGLDRVSKAVFDSQVDLYPAEQAVEDVFKLAAVEVVQLVDGNYFHAGQQICRILFRGCNAGLH